MNFLSFVRFWTPYGFVEARRTAISARRQKDTASSRAKFHERRHALVQETLAAAISANGAPTFTVESAVRFLLSRGLEERHVREGSIPERSLDFIAGRFAAESQHEGRTLALHVGNFLGMSLAALTSILVKRDPAALVIAVDPNVPHRGIYSPQHHALALLEHFGLQGNVLPIVGYSSTKSVSNDGVEFAGYDPSVEHDKESACENVLENLSTLLRGRLSVAIVDGNHDAEYLREEVDRVRVLMSNGGLLILDDVDENWVEIKGVFDSVDSRDWESVGSDGRVGVLRRARNRG